VTAAAGFFFVGIGHARVGRSLVAGKSKATLPQQVEKPNIPAFPQINQTIILL
jgi:hypothetical protein